MPDAGRHRTHIVPDAVVPAVGLLSSCGTAARDDRHDRLREWAHSNRNEAPVIAPAVFESRNKS